MKKTKFLSSALLFFYSCQYPYQNFKPNSIQGNEKGPLHKAVKEGKKEEVEDLISSNEADVNSKNEYNLTPLQVAILNNNVEMVEFLVAHGADINEQDPDMGTPLDLASNLHREEIINFLKSNEAMTCDELKIFSLFEAVKNGKKEEVEGLISKGADVNSKNKNNLTPLQVAILKNNVEMVEFLVDHGANINEKDPDRGGTPLDLASNLHREEIINFLKSNEAMTCDELKIFSLFEAAQNGNIETLKKLISRGADINRKDRLGNTALHYAVVSDNFEIVKYLIEAGASILIRDRKGRTPDWYVKSSRIYSFFEELKKKQLEELKKKQQILKSFEI